MWGGSQAEEQEAGVEGAEDALGDPDDWEVSSATCANKHVTDTFS